MYATNMPYLYVVLLVGRMWPRSLQGRPTGDSRHSVTTSDSRQTVVSGGRGCVGRAYGGAGRGVNLGE